MSWSALLTAVRNRIRTGCGYADRDCDTTYDGQPHPRCGKVFVAVHKGARRGQSRTCLDQVYEVLVTVTMRINEPIDRLSSGLLLKAEEGLEPRVDAIIAAVHADSLNYVVSNAANTLLGDPGTGAAPIGFREALAYVDDGPSRVVPGSWFHADPDSLECGVATTIRFGKARRIQLLGEMS